MKPKHVEQSLPLFQSRLDQIINMSHPLSKLARSIDWSVFEEEFKSDYCEDNGRPGKSIRLMVGLHYLKHAFDESDESVVARFLENPYWQYFCGFEYFQHEFPLDPTSLVKWRRRVGAEKLELLLQETISTARRGKHLKKGDCRRVNVDTTVQEKAITYPTAAKLYQKMRLKLVAAAKERGIGLRQSYARLGKHAYIMQNRYRHARHHKRAARMLKDLKNYLGRVYRDIIRKVDAPDAELAELLAMADRLLKQKRNSKNKLYSIHAPEVECISKGKAHKKYEFGCKAGVVSTSQGNWIIGARAFHQNPYDGHTLDASVEQAESVCGASFDHIHVDRGYRGHNYRGAAQVHIAGSKGKKSRWDRLWRKRRAAVEPVIGHMKHDNRMNRNYLKGREGDQINAILAACGYNMRKLLKAFFLPNFREAVLRIFKKNYRPTCPLLMPTVG